MDNAQFCSTDAIDIKWVSWHTIQNCFRDKFLQIDLTSMVVLLVYYEVRKLKAAVHTLNGVEYLKSHLY